MKKLSAIFILFILTLTMAASISFGAEKKAKSVSSEKQWSRPYGLAGCGLGSVLMGKNGNQIFAATTNGTVYSQFFGITSGTLNCVDDPNAEVASNVDRYILVNQAALAGDIARGNGETLSALSFVMGCKDVNKADLGQALQKNFEHIFPNSEVAPNEVTDAIISVILNEQTLASKCHLVG